jgi:hypothetical protein
MRARPNCRRATQRGSAKPLQAAPPPTTSHQRPAAPMAIYEVHAGSWKRPGGCPRDARPGTTSRSTSCPMPPAWASPTWNCCPSASTRSTPPGATSPPACTHPPRATAARRLPPLRRRGPRRRPEDHPGLGAGPLPDRRTRAGALRRHRAVRARRPARRLPPRLEHADLQLRPPRGEELPGRQRAVLDRAVRHRRPARGRRGVHALPRLQPPCRRVGAQPRRRARELRGHRLPARGARGAAARSAAGHDHRRRIDRFPAK